MCAFVPLTSSSLRSSPRLTRSVSLIYTAAAAIEGETQISGGTIRLLRVPKPERSERSRDFEFG